MADIKVNIEAVVPQEILAAGVDVDSDQSVADFVGTFLSFALPAEVRDKVQITVTVDRGQGPRLTSDVTDEDRAEARRLADRESARAAFPANVVEGSE